MKQRTRRIGQNIGILCLIVLGLGWIVSRFMHFPTSTYTDNARICQQIIPVHCRIAGYVREIRFDDFSAVHRGDTLAVIDDIEYRLRVAQAEADLQTAASGSLAASAAQRTIDNDCRVSDAAIDEAAARLSRAEAEYRRYVRLYDEASVTRSQLDAVTADYKALQANWERLNRQRQSTRLSSEAQSHRIGQQTAGIERARVVLDLARLNLSYTVITAPCDGFVSKKELQVGQFIQPGQLVVKVTDSSDRWVMANYRERQAARMQAGDRVRIRVDAVPGVTYSGVIEAISSATGTQYALIPQDNATGNFVKVEQRLPVKIRFTEENDAADLSLLRAGMNVECRVTVSR